MVTTILLMAVALLIAFLPVAYLLGYLTGLPRRMKLERRNAALEFEQSGAEAIANAIRESIAKTVSALEDARAEVMGHYLASVSSPEPVQKPVTHLMKLSPGTTGCQACNLVIQTPDNQIPGEWLLAHADHGVQIEIAQGACFKASDVIE